MSGLLSNASNAETLRRVINARSRINQLKQDAYDAPQQLKKLNQIHAGRLEFRSQLEHEVGELGVQIQGLNVIEINELETGRQNAQKRIQEVSQQIGSRQLAIGSYQKQKKVLEKELASIAAQNTVSAALWFRKQLLERAGLFIAGLLETYEEEARSSIEDEITRILEEVAHRPYKCKIESNFSIDLTFADGRSVPRSGGENQLLSLLFIGALIQFAGSRMNETRFILKPGTIAPLILDAPFGQLDPYYQRDVAFHIPKLTHQVVLLVSSSQGNEGVLKALEPFVGAEYVLVSENRENMGNRGVTELTLNGTSYVTSLFEQPKTMTRIERIR
ncbi:MAG: hypothetical protein IPK01_00680 [Acidobacteria bacterium]|nr:hypothetical protein [Acidobacteriota bacterium]